MGVSMMNPDLRRKIKVRMRPDLVINKQRYGGQSYFIVKDPVGLRYFRFREEELFLLSQLDGDRTLDDVRHEFIEKFRPQRLSVPELEKFVSQLLQAGLATAQTPQVGQRLFERYEKRQRDKIKQLFVNLLYLKVPIFDPERLLSKMLPYTRFFFSIPFFLLALTFGLASLMLVLVNWSTFISKLPTYQDFFTWRNILTMWLLLGIVKVLHEFGHGLSCRVFGGEVHEMGLLFLVFTPCLYCNVTDAWMLPSKWHRAVIGAAGMYVELILSSIFVWVWWYTEPGLINTLSLSLIFVCSVSTVLFNANPLMRFDGYYILSDLAEIPNLRERSNKYLGAVAGRLFLGEDTVKDPFAPQAYKWLFVTYAVAAYLYRIFITVTILYFLYTFLRPYKLGIISAILALGSAVSMIVLPVQKVVKHLTTRWRTLKVDKVRMAVAITTAVLAILAVLLTPLPMRIDAPMILLPKDAETLYSPGGTLESLYVKDGDRVKAGQLLAIFEDRELEMELETRREEYEQYQKAAQAYHVLNQEAYAQQAESKSKFVYADIQRLENKLLQLRLVAQHDGMVLTPPKPQDVGKLLKPGEEFCQLGDPTRIEAYIVVPQSDIGLIQSRRESLADHTSLRIWIKVYGHVGPILQSSVASIFRDEIQQLPQALSNKAGGEVQTTTDPRTNREMPMIRSYAVFADVSNPDSFLVPGSRGTARFDVGYRSLLWRGWWFFQQTLNFRL